ncbi:MAG: 3-phosphoserine/phosphohydroxythreonine aminotransferase [Ectothiorhodospiraceae bacterium]|nr:3-phosphoserine/phosphohydroxythreonine aminotransferase [Ectothiorhodospiraceae bacterium]
MATRAHNFFAGPAILPVPVIEAARDAAYNFADLGMSIMEISHRSKEFDQVMVEAQQDALKIMGLSADEYAVLYLGGGASTQFAMLPLNFLHTKADYVNTGEWATKAIKEAKMLGETNVVATSEDANFNYIPKDITWTPGSDYAHITTNNTIYGTQWNTMPDTGDIPLVADMSSDMLSRPLDFSKFNLIYAGAQKNLGPSGVTLIIVKKAWVEEKAKKENLTMFKYATHIKKDSMFNTPPSFPVYVVGQTLKWIMNEGGLEVIEERNIRKAKLIYDIIDAYPEYYKGAVANKEDRSLMNITWNLPTEELEAKFVADAKAKGLYGLKGHRSVGGIRASTYNACPVESVEALAAFMEEFKKNNA